MAVLHYGNAKIKLTDGDVQALTSIRNGLAKPGLHSVKLDGGWLHFVTGPGVPFLIDERNEAR